MKQFYSILIFFAIGFVLHISTAIAETDDQKKNNVIEERKINLAFNYFSYISYSPTKPTFPFEKGYPSFNTNTAGISFNYFLKIKKIKHYLGINAILPSKITSDNGLGTNYLLRTSESKYNRGEFNYYLYDELYKINSLHFLYGFSASVFYENRKLFFNSEDIIQQQDLNLGIGPTLGIEWDINNFLIFKAEGHLLVYLPYTCYGDYSFESAEYQSRTDKYHPIMYKTLWQLTLDQRIKDNIFIHAGYRNTNQNGYGNSKNSLMLSNVIVSKIDRINELFLGITIDIK